MNTILLIILALSLLGTLLLLWPCLLLAARSDAQLPEPPDLE